MAEFTFPVLKECVAKLQNGAVDEQLQGKYSDAFLNGIVENEPDTRGIIQLIPTHGVIRVGKRKKNVAFIRVNAYCSGCFGERKSKAKYAITVDDDKPIPTSPNYFNVKSWSVREL